MIILHRSALIGAISLLVIGSPSVLADSCLSPEVVTRPDLSKLPDGADFIERMRTEFGRITLQEVRWDFHEETYRNRAIVRVSEHIVLDFSELISGLREASYHRTRESQNCNTLMRPHSFDLQPVNGDLIGGFLIETTFRACQIFDVPCFEDGKITSCRVEWNQDLLSHTFGVNISLRRVFYTNVEREAKRQLAIAELQPAREAAERIEEPNAKAAALAQLEQAVESAAVEKICADPTIAGRAPSEPADAIAFCGASEFDRRGFDIHRPIPNFLLNLIGVATLNVGSKFILDNYRAKLSDVTALVNRAFSANLPGRRQLIRMNDSEQMFSRSMALSRVHTGFGLRSVDGSVSTIFTAVTEHPAGTGRGVQRPTFCQQVRPVFTQYGNLLRSTTQGDRTVTVSGGASLWRIAEEAYGSGHYFVTLLPANNIAYRQANRLRPGANLTIPAMYSIWQSERRVVEMGDSLWSISRRNPHSNADHRDLFRRNGIYLESADRIYPIQLLLLDRD
jgi:nucleoid-associated protein YgaU